MAIRRLQPEWSSIGGWNIRLCCTSTFPLCRVRYWTSVLPGWGERRIERVTRTEAYASTRPPGNFTKGETQQRRSGRGNSRRDPGKRRSEKSQKMTLRLLGWSERARAGGRLMPSASLKEYDGLTEEISPIALSRRGSQRVCERHTPVMHIDENVRKTGLLRGKAAVRSRARETLGPLLYSLMKGQKNLPLQG